MTENARQIPGGPQQRVLLACDGATFSGLGEEKLRSQFPVSARKSSVLVAPRSKTLVGHTPVMPQRRFCGRSRRPSGTLERHEVHLLATKAPRSNDRHLRGCRQRNRGELLAHAWLGCARDRKNRDHPKRAQILNLHGRSVRTLRKSFGRLKSIAKEYRIPGQARLRCTGPLRKAVGGSTLPQKGEMAMLCAY